MRWRAPRSTSLLLAVLAVTAAPAAAAQVQSASDLVQSACHLPHEQLLRIARGTRTDRSGEVQIVPKQPNYVAGGYSHAGPWNYLQRVPVFWYGPGFVRGKGRVSAPVTSADVCAPNA